jgi:HK97 gp10 family phage protein
MTNDVDIDLLGDEANIYKKAASRAIPIRKTKKEPSGAKWHPPGAGKKSIMKKMGRNRRNATVFVGPRTKTGDYQTDAWYLKFWEYGTKYLPPNLRIQASYAANKQKVEQNMYHSIRKIFTRTVNKHKKT